MKEFLVIFLLFFSSLVFGQEKFEKQDFLPFAADGKSHSLGINAILSPVFFFDRPETLPMEIVYRRFNKKNQTFRFRLEGRYDKSLEENLPFYEEKWSSSLGGAVGYEWHKPISQRWSWYYGGEVGITHDWEDEKNIKLIINETSKVGATLETNRILNKNVSGFFGVLHNFSSRMYLTLECNLVYSSQILNSDFAGRIILIDADLENFSSSTIKSEDKFIFYRISTNLKIGVHLKF